MTTSDQSVWGIGILFYLPEMVFQEIAGKVAIGFFFLIQIFENTAFGHVTEVPTKVKQKN